MRERHDLTAVRTDAVRTVRTCGTTPGHFTKLFSGQNVCGEARMYGVKVLGFQKRRAGGHFEQVTCQWRSTTEDQRSSEASAEGAAYAAR